MSRFFKSAAFPILIVVVLAFLAVKLAGAAYLIYLGARMLFTRSSAVSLSENFSSVGFFPVFRRGMLTNILNPKVALFFLAFMPQFIADSSPNKFLAFITLGLCFVTTGTIWCLCLASFASLLGDRLRGSAASLNRAAGALFIALGIRLAAAR